MIYSTLSRYHAITLSEDEKGGKFNSHFVKRTNVRLIKCEANRRIQEEGEAVDVFITALTLCSSGEVRLEGGDDQRQDYRRHTWHRTVTKAPTGPWPDITKGSYTDKRSRVSEEQRFGTRRGLYRQCTGSSQRHPKKQFQRGQNAPTRNLAVTDVAPPWQTAMSCQRSRVSSLWKKRQRQYVEQRTLEKFITKSMIVLKIVTKWR